MSSFCALLRPQCPLFHIVVLCCSLSGAFAQKDVYFPYFDLVNLEPDYGLQASSSQLLKAYIEDHHDYHILLPNNNNEYYEKEDLAASFKYAEERGADFVLSGALVELGDKYVISLGLYDTRFGKQVWHDMLKGNVREDLDPLLSRLGRSFNTPTKARDDATLEEVTNYESEVVESVQNTIAHYFGVSIGGNYIFNEQTVSGFGLAYTLDAKNVLIWSSLSYYPNSSELSGDGTSREFRHGSFDIGAAFPFSHKPMSFFAMGGMDYGFHNLRQGEPTVSETNGGIGFFFGGGYLINRGSLVNLRINAALALPLYQVDGEHLMGLKFGLTASLATHRR